MAENENSSVGNESRATSHESRSVESSTNHVPRTTYHDADDEISLLDILIVLAKHKKLVLGLPFLAAVITAGITLLMPNWYTATVKLLPPQQSQSSAMAILGQLGAISGGASQALGLKNPSDIFVAMLKSRTVADAIIERFELKELYDQEFLQDARKALAGNTTIAAGRDGVITISVDDKSPQRAADMANAYIEELERLTLRLAVGEAGRRRLFFERQLKQAKDDLTQAETELTKFQIEKKVLNPQGQASLTIVAAAGLQAQIAAKEVQITALKSFATQDNPDLYRAQEELAGLRTQLAKVGRGGSRDPGDVLLSMGKAPEQGAEYLRRFRDMKYYETLYELLARQYEIARIDESKDATLIQVLDRAVPPERKSGPVRRRIVLLTLLVSFLVAVMGVFLAGSISRLATQPEGRRRLETLKQNLRIRLPGTAR
ncbi:MAG: Wzz/FepE/Etk N-terminal domain-containing protein [Pseudomonadota bacterium]